MTAIARNEIPRYQCDSEKTVIARSFSDEAISSKISGQAQQSPEEAQDRLHNLEV